jgi:hypothetical protein
MGHRMVIIEMSIIDYENSFNGEYRPTSRKTISRTSEKKTGRFNPLLRQVESSIAKKKKMKKKRRRSMRRGRRRRKIGP